MPLDETEYRLDSSATLIFDASGTGDLTFGPVPTHERWEVQRYVTFCTGFGCRASLHRNFVAQETAIDDTLRAESDVGGIQINLQRGERLIFHYTAGTTGDNVSAHIEGVRYVKGRRAYG